MKYTITEEIINNAINESINEFMLEEGFGDTLKDWGQKVKGWGQSFDNKYGNKFSKAWNGLKNGVKAYMDYRTNGAWNREYGSYVKGNGRFSGNFYISKWLDYHHNRLQDIMYGDYYGNKTYYYTEIDGRSLSFKHNWNDDSYILTSGNYYNTITYKMKLDNYSNQPAKITVYDSSNAVLVEKEPKTASNGNQKVYRFIFDTSGVNNLDVYQGEDNSTPESYIAQNCTANAFLNYTRNTLNGDYKNKLSEYINYIQQNNKENIEELKTGGKLKHNYNYMLGLFTMKGLQNWLSQNGNSNQQNRQQASQPGNTQQTQQQNQSDEQGGNPNWYKQNPPPEDYNNNQHGQTSSGFNDAGHEAPNTTQQKPNNRDKWDPNYGKHINIRTGKNFN